MDFDEDQAQLYRPDGDLLWFFGRSGEGPGEFDGPAFGTILGGEELVVAESSGRLTRVRPVPDGEVRTVTTDLVQITDGAVVDDSTVVLAATDPTERMGGRLHLWDLERETVIRSAFEHLDEVPPNLAGMSGYAVVDAHASRIVAGLGPLGSLFVLDDDGTELRRLDLPERVFREGEDISRAAFQDPERRAEWLASYETITDVHFAGPDTIYATLRTMEATGEGPMDVEPRWHVVGVTVDEGEVFLHVTDTAQLQAVLPATGTNGRRLLFQAPRTPSAWWICQRAGSAAEGETARTSPDGAGGGPRPAADWPSTTVSFDLVAGRPEVVVPSPDSVLVLDRRAGEIVVLARGAPEARRVTVPDGLLSATVPAHDLDRGPFLAVTRSGFGGRGADADLPLPVRDVGAGPGLQHIVTSGDTLAYVRAAPGDDDEPRAFLLVRRRPAGEEDVLHRVPRAPREEVSPEGCRASFQADFEPLGPGLVQASAGSEALLIETHTYRVLRPTGGTLEERARGDARVERASDSMLESWYESTVGSLRLPTMRTPTGCALNAELYLDHARPQLPSAAVLTAAADDEGRLAVLRLREDGERFLDLRGPDGSLRHSTALPSAARWLGGMPSGDEVVLLSDAGAEAGASDLAVWRVAVWRWSL